MQFFLDDVTTVPVRLFSVSNAPTRRQQPNLHPEAPSRSVPGCPYIQFVNDNDYDGSYPFDAFQDLRSAYGASPLAGVQARMRAIQQQRAQAQLRRQLLEQQIKEHAQRERELLHYQQLLEQQRQEHARAAAKQARQAYLSRLQAEEQARQLENAKSVEEGKFLPPFHFFNHILEHQLRSQDDIERRRAHKSALEDLLDAYFSHSAPMDQKPASPQQQQQQQPPAAATAERSPQLSEALPSQKAASGADAAVTMEPSVLENVLRVVHDRLNEIAAQEEGQAAEKSPEPARSTVAKDEPKSAELPEQKGVEVEEPVDYSKLANFLRSRVDTLNDDNTFVPRSPPLERQSGAEWTEASKSAAKSPTTQQPPAGFASPAAMQVGNGGAEELTDSEFAGLMSECKAQLKDLQDATTAATAHPEASSQAKRHRRHRHRSRHRLQSSPRLPPQPYNAAPAPPNVELAAKAAAAAAGNQSATGKPESRTQQQKQAVNTIEDYILGARNARRAKDALSSLRQLHMVEQELDAIRKQYNRQLSDMQLSFVADKSGNLRLAFNRDNAPFLAYQDVLQKLLFKLDEIPSHGDEVVRAKRKAVVVKIQDTLDALDQFAADQESEITGSSATEGVLADESSNGDF